MDGAGEEFFPRPRFAQEQDGQGRFGPFLEVSEQVEKRTVLCDDPQLTAFMSELVEFDIAEASRFRSSCLEVMKLAF